MSRFLVKYRKLIFALIAILVVLSVLAIPLIMTILSGIYVNIWASGLGGNTMYYLSYLIIQGILMGATIDYTILFVLPGVIAALDPLLIRKRHERP